VVLGAWSRKTKRVLAPAVQFQPVCLQFRSFFRDIKSPIDSRGFTVRMNLCPSKPDFYSKPSGLECSRAGAGDPAVIRPFNVWWLPSLVQEKIRKDEARGFNIYDLRADSI